jgi:uncharacterized membrane protein
VPTRIRLIKPKPLAKRTLADKCSELIGSWKFIGTQAACLFFWILINVSAPVKWDKPPFVLLNLLLSFQAAFTGPVLLMAANRQSEIDRKRDIDHYMIDVHDSELLQELAIQVEHIHKYVEHHDEEHW